MTRWEMEVDITYATQDKLPSKRGRGKEDANVIAFIMM